MKPISIVYAAMCVLVPVGWGLVVYWSTSLIEAKISRKSNASGTTSEKDHLDVDYHI